jgi:predicted DNA-binding protein YlxM (UPF0122 family)
MLSDVTFSHFCNDNHEYKIMAPRVYLPLLKKVELIKDYDRQFSQRDLATKYKISTGAVCNILKRKQEYLDDFESNQCHEVRRKIKNNLRRKIDEETYSWFVAQRAKNITLSGPTIQEKARQIAAYHSVLSKSIFK